jgi:hypothetical protein
VSLFCEPTSIVMCPDIDDLTINDTEVYTDSGNCPMSSVRCMFMFSSDVYNEGVANRKSEECSFVRCGASSAPIYLCCFTSCGFCATGSSGLRAPSVNLVPSKAHTSCAPLRLENTSSLVGLVRSMWVC